MPNALIWGADKSGATDSSKAVQNAVNYLCSAGGGDLRVPAGLNAYKFHDVTSHCGGLNIHAAGATIDCSGMTDHCIQVVPTGFPAQRRLVGFSIDGAQFINSNTSGRIIDIKQVYNPSIHDIVMANVAAGATAIRLFGVQNPDLRNIDGSGIPQIINGTNGTFIEYAGDMSGKSSTGGACTLGDCSTRSDLLVINNVRGAGANSSAVALYWHDQASTVQVNEFQFRMDWKGSRFDARLASQTSGIAHSSSSLKG